MIGKLLREDRTAVVKKELENHKKAIAKLERELSALEGESEKNNRGNTR